MPLELEDNHGILIDEEKHWHILVKLYETCRNYELKDER
jgi:hypothetical protein